LKNKLGRALLPVLVIAGFGINARAAEEKDIAPNGKGHWTLDNPGNGAGNGNAGAGLGGGPQKSNGISYHGGAVML
jgi:hypothetical protein